VGTKAAVLQWLQAKKALIILADKPMKLSSSFLQKWVLVGNLLLASAIAFSSDAQAGDRMVASNNYRSSCSFYGQDQPQAQSIGCSISQSSSQIVIRWNDGLITTLNNSGNGNWRSMPSGSRAEARFYYGTGRVAHVQIYEGPGKGLIIVKDGNPSGSSPVQASYRSQCSFYGQNQEQAQSIGCSISQQSSKIVIRWEDGFTTTLDYSRNSNWRSMPSGSRAEARFYQDSGRVAHVEIYEGPGKGIIIVRPF
jgi:hypothetical protein